MQNQLTATTLASLLLLYKGEISKDEIMALPLIEDEDEAMEVMSVLSLLFDCEIHQEKDKSSSIPTWEEIIRLRPKLESVLQANVC